MATEIRVPTLGESVTEATIGQWFKKVGDTVAADEPVVELETDKVTLEIRAPESGTLKTIAAEGATAPATIARPRAASHQTPSPSIGCRIRTMQRPNNDARSQLRRPLEPAPPAW